MQFIWSLCALGLGGVFLFGLLMGPYYAHWKQYFRRERPTMEQLLATGDCEGSVYHGLHMELRIRMSELKKQREKAGLSLSEVAKRSGIEKAALSRLENGLQINPTLDTLGRYARALGKVLELKFADAREACEK